MQEEEIQAIKEGFEAKYPQITMNYFFAGTNKVLTKLATEMQSGEIAADLVWTGAPSDYRKLKENRYLSPYISPQAININEAFMDEHHYYIGGRLMSAVIAYNTDLVSEEDAPRTWDDLLDPRWNGQIVMTDPGSSGSCIAAFLYVAASEWWLRFLDTETYIGSFKVPFLRTGFRMVVFSVIIMVVVLFFRKGIMGDKELPDLLKKRQKKAKKEAVQP